MSGFKFKRQPEKLTFLVFLKMVEDSRNEKQVMTTCGYCLVDFENYSSLYLDLIKILLQTS